ncbi:hypothetical protein SCHPADRAFT_924988 [Schizopora paradoxa]|uniref:DUF6533 domain-containing protein n=1 Tax=Schizopora paradoxa TaxID=27342 RepID=A0A0H2SAK6_9AGAM|nr:hypothetical protein SCHPADRAFT_924988 [Schizopora paradoxa]
MGSRATLEPPHPQATSSNPLDTVRESMSDVELLMETVNISYAYFAAGALVVYDIAICLGDEINFIWTQKWTSGKIVYILTRYWGVLDSIAIMIYIFFPLSAPDSCKAVYNLVAWTAKPGVIICSMVFVFRTYAIWGRSLYVLAYLSLIQVVYIFVLVFSLIQSNEYLTFPLSPIPNIVPCMPTPGNNKLFILFCYNMIFEFNVLCLSLYKKFFHWRGGSTRIIHTLYRDGVLYFAVLFSISLANVILVVTMFASRSPYYLFLVAIQDVLHTILTSRILLNLRKAAGVGHQAHVMRIEDEELFESDRSYTRGFRNRVVKSVTTHLDSF